MGSNGFIRKKVHTLTLGEKLKKLRDDKRISVHDVSKYTGIKEEYLEFLESGNYKRLPADVYVKGFLRSYANYFCISPEGLVRLFEREKGIQHNKESGKKKKPHFLKARASSFVFTPKMIITFFIVLTVLGSFLYLYKEFDNFISEPRLIITEPVSGSTVYSLSTPIYGIAEKDADVYINGQSVLVDEEGGFEQEVELHEGMNAIIVEAENIFSKKAVQEVFIEVKFKEKQDEKNDTKDDKDQAMVLTDMMVYVEQESVWLQVFADEKEVFSGIVEPKDRQEYQFENKIQISSSNGRLTHVIIDEKDMGTLSDSESVVEKWQYVINTDQKGDGGGE